MFDQHRAYGIATSTRFLPTFVNSATVVEKSRIICRRISRFLQISLSDSYAASVKKERLFSQSKELLQETTSFKEGYYCICFFFKISVQKSACQKTPPALDMHYILNTCTFSITITIILNIFGPQDTFYYINLKLFWSTLRTTKNVLQVENTVLY